MVCFSEIPTWAISDNSRLMFGALSDHIFRRICFMYTIKGHQKSNNSGNLGLARCSEWEYDSANVDLEYPLVSRRSFAIDVLGWKLYNVCAIQFYDPTRDVCFWKNWGSLQSYILMQLYPFCAWIGDTIGSHSLENQCGCRPAKRMVH